MSGSRRLAGWLSAPLLCAFFGAFLVYPVLYVVRGAFVVDGAFGLTAFRLLFDNDVLVASLQNSAVVAVVVTVLSSLIALPLALLFARFEFRGKGLVQGLLLAALVLPPFVAAIGVRQLFASCGSVNLLLMQLGWITSPIDFLGAHPILGVTAMETLHLYPILFLNLVAALANVDPSLEEAAECAGASRWTRFFRVTLPLVLPGWFAGSVVVFIFALTDLGSPIVFDARELVAWQIFERAVEGGRDPVGYALVLLVLAATAVLFAAGRRYVARKSGAQASKGSVHARTRRLGPAARVAVALALGALVALTLLPHVAIALVAASKQWFFTVLPESYGMDHFERVLKDPIAYTGVKNSLIYAACSTAIDLALGLFIAWRSVRGGGRLAALLDALATLPLALPGIVLAFGYAAGFAGTWLDPLQGPFLLIVIGYSVRRLPYVVRAADAGLRQVPVALEEASVSLGASRWRTLRRVTLPLLLGHLLAGGLLAFAFAMLEVSESLILAPSKESFPIAKAIYSLLGDLSDGPQIASAMGVIGALLLLYALLAAGRLLGKSAGELFRA